MNQLYIFAAIALVPFISCFPSSYNSEFVPFCRIIDPFAIYSGQPQFAVSLLNTLQKATPEKNHFFSPHSTYHALLLAYFGAEGQTLETLERALFLKYGKLSAIENYKEFKKLREDWCTFDRRIEFSTIDKVYVTKDAELHANITDLLDAAIQKVDFSQPQQRITEINEFVETFTKGHIKDLLSRDSIQQQTNLVLLNAAYFKGLWKTQFEKGQTVMKPFNGVTPSNVEMMHVQGQFHFGVNEKLKAAFLDMPYKTKNDERPISMQVFLPLKNTPTAVNELIDNLRVEDINEVWDRRVMQLVDVEFPKMSMDVSYDSLADVLSKMGVKNLFGTTSDLSGFSSTTKLSFDDMIHKAKIEIDEEGSVAAAATATVSRGISPSPVEFHCDHPFVFVIHDVSAGVILFTGVYRGN